MFGKYDYTLRKCISNCIKSVKKCNDYHIITRKIIINQFYTGF